MRAGAPQGQARSIKVRARHPAFGTHAPMRTTRKLRHQGRGIRAPPPATAADTRPRGRARGTSWAQRWRAQGVATLARRSSHTRGGPRRSGWTYLRKPLLEAARFRRFPKGGNLPLEEFVSPLWKLVSPHEHVEYPAVVLLHHAHNVGERRLLVDRFPGGSEEAARKGG